LNNQNVFQVEAGHPIVTKFEISFLFWNKTKEQRTSNKMY
jgi:hypothetical protein